MASIAPPTATPASTAPTATVAVASINEVATPLLSLSQFAIFENVFITTPRNSLTSCCVQLYSKASAKSQVFENQQKVAYITIEYLRILSCGCRAIHQSWLISWQKSPDFRPGFNIFEGYAWLYLIRNT